MTSFQIKLLAILFMIVDHIGVYLFPNIILLRVIGRLSFPLFCWLIANGARYTHNINSYLFRLFVFALISQYPFYLVNKLVGIPWALNVFFTLSLGLLAIKILKESKSVYLNIAVVLLASLVAEFSGSDYGMFGVLSIVLFYIYFGKPKETSISQTVVYFLAVTYTVAVIYLTVANPLYYYIIFLKPFGLLSLMFINNYNKRSGPKTGYLFYAVYPVQYFLFYILKL